MIELDHVSKSFGDGADRTVAVDDLSVSIGEGEIVALVGSSGSGKTTTLRMINRLIEPSSGRITVDGRDVSTLPAHQLRRGIGYVIQQGGLFPHRTVLGNVGTVPRLLGWDKARTDDRSRQMLDLVGLDAGLADRYPAQLSGGQQQRVGVARALAADPPVLLMDEPFGAVDPIVRAQLQREFARLQRELGKTVVFVTHDVDEAIILADRIAVLAPGGRLEQVAPPAELLAHPASDFVADFLGKRTVEFEAGVPIGYRIESRFVANGTPAPLTAER
jgi:osmoprotectant transport system ATP-binding protein